MKAAVRVLPAVLLLAACAQVREPQGGPKDERAPELLSAEPANGSTRFNARRIVLHFDERIKLDRVRERLLISPPLAERPEVTIARGTDVVIDLQAPLLPNTTYTFNIGETVQDLSEGNAAAGLAYVVSTGDHLDSLSVQGQVVDAFTGTAAASVLVLLHDTADTAGVVRGVPAYFTRTDAAGLFTLSHLHAGSYHLTALRDQNADLRYDLPNEDIAFAPAPVDPTDSTTYRLPLFRPVPTDQQVSEARVLPDRGWRMVLARPAVTMDLSSLDREGGVLRWWPEWSMGRDTVVFWPSDTTQLADQRFAVSENGRVLDTLTYRPTQKMPFNLTAQVVQDPVDRTVSVVASRPLAALDTARMRLRADTTDLAFAASLDTADRRVVRLATSLENGRRATLELLPQALRDLYGGTNDTLALGWGRAGAETFGKLRVRTVLDSASVVPGPFILQLLGAQGQVVREQAFERPPHATDWALLAPGSYSLRLISDRNGDGRWTTGSFTDRLQPEPTYAHPEPVTVRANWDVEVEWSVRP